MARGGARAGAGRKTGARTKKTREVAEKAAAKGLTPIEVMLWAMREFMTSIDAQNDPVEKMKMAKSAADIAEKAAPYVHPKISPQSENAIDKQIINVHIHGGLPE